mmetsp:Transcript_62584/g.147177  ORF Transcript_62584/g.147177 Transcript_62584/m.147177 type:complete len:422 (+) Transcript_62584:99-1364(+)
MVLDLPEDFARMHLEGTMEGWYQPTTFGSAAIVAHWITFLFLTLCTMYLARDSWTAKGPGGKELYFAGYHEEYNISLYVNLFAMIAYFGKVVADSMGHNYNNVGPMIIGLGNYRYADYMLTCPLLAWDLMAQVRAPYKITGAILIFCVLLSGAATNFYPGEQMKQGAIAWFCFGCFLYAAAYYLFFSIVKKQYSRLVALSANTEAKKAFMPLKLALYTFFSIWVVFPIVWILGYHGLNILTNDAQECLHCTCDLIAKSFYGFALAKYRKYFDKKMYDMLEELGVDAEEGLGHLEKDLKECDPQEGQSIDIRRLSMTQGASKVRDHSAFSPEPFPPHTNGNGFYPMEHGNRQPSLGGSNFPHFHNGGQNMPAQPWRGNSSQSSPRGLAPEECSNVDHLRQQLDAINEQLRQEYERKGSTRKV